MMERFVQLLIIVAVLALGFFLVDYIGASATNHELLIVSKQYQGTRTGVDTNGDVNVTFPKYDLLIEFPATGERDLVSTSKASWITVDAGKVYRFYCRYGRLSGWRLNCFYGEHS